MNKALAIFVALLSATACSKQSRRAAPPPQTAGPPPAPPQAPPAHATPILQLPPLLTPQGWGIPLPAPVPTAASSWSQLEWDALQRVNGYRARGFICGGQLYPPTQPLRPHPALQSAARAHSWDMGRRNFYDHRTPEGHGPSDRVRANGYPAGAAENIHVQKRTALEVVDDWMRSAGHCRNFMNPELREVGIGHAEVPGSRYGHYWTANMGSGAR